MRRIVERIGLITAAVFGVVLAIWQAVRAATMGEQLRKERTMRVLAEVEAKQADVEAKAAKAREAAAKDQATKIAKLNQEVVHVDPHSSDLAGAFDRATGPSPIGPEDTTPGRR